MAKKGVFYSTSNEFLPTKNEETTRKKTKKSPPIRKPRPTHEPVGVRQ